MRDELDGDLAYTTVMTVLTRLNEKGLTARTARGRAFAYAPTVSESELVAKRMSAELSATNDRAGALGAGCFAGHFGAGGRGRPSGAPGASGAGR